MPKLNTICLGAEIGIISTKLCINVDEKSESFKKLLEKTKDLELTLYPAIIKLNNTNILCLLFKTVNLKSILIVIRSIFESECNFNINLIGGKADVYEDIIKDAIKSPNSNFNYIKDNEASIQSIDKLIKIAPEYFFNYTETVHMIMDCSPIPIDINYIVQTLNKSTNIYPYILVNFKLGVSYHYVHSKTESFRLGGSILGGATYIGLTNILYGLNSDLLQPLIVGYTGDQSNVDLLVSDIYGNSYNNLGIAGNLVASTLGKLKKKNYDIIEDNINDKIELNYPISDIYKREYDATIIDFTQHVKKNIYIKNYHTAMNVENEHIPIEQPRKISKVDIVKSILSAVSYNVAQLAYLNAEVYNCKNIIVSGDYIEHPAYLASIQHILDIWSKKKICLYFVKPAVFLSSISNLF